MRNTKKFCFPKKDNQVDEAEQKLPEKIFGEDDNDDTISGSYKTNKKELKLLEKLCTDESKGKSNAAPSTSKFWPSELKVIQQNHSVRLFGL